jgi:hypothetical protein
MLTIIEQEDIQCFMRDTSISYRFYTNHQGSDDTLYWIEVHDNTKNPLQIFTSLVSLEDAMQQAEAWRKLYEQGLIDESDIL